MVAGSITRICPNRLFEHLTGADAVCLPHRLPAELSALESVMAKLNIKFILIGHGLVVSIALLNVNYRTPTYPCFPCRTQAKGIYTLTEHERNELLLNSLTDVEIEQIWNWMDISVHERLAAVSAITLLDFAH